VVTCYAQELTDPFAVSEKPCFARVDGDPQEHTWRRLREELAEECRRAWGILIQIPEHQPSGMAGGMIVSRDLLVQPTLPF
jgi:hypothetical protein